MSHPPALALVEIGSLARGYVVLDAVAKKAPVTVTNFEEVSPGKTLLVFVGGESEVEESLEEARVLCGSALLDLLILPAVHPSVVAALRSVAPVRVVESLGVIETRTAAAAVRAADAGRKAADVELIKLRLARGIGGKGLVLFTGELGDTDAALAAAAEAAGGGAEGEAVLGRELITQPHPEIIGRFTAG